MKHYNITVIGKVQGVFYRASTQEKAQALGLTGFVRNEPDRSVYIECEGEEETLQTFLAWCKQGPPMARVDKIDTQEGPIQGFTEFRIQR